MTTLIDSQFILQTLLANNPDPVVVKDAELRVIIANPAFLNLFPEQYQSQIIGSRLDAWMTSSEIASMVERDRITLETGSSRVVETITLSDGQVRVFDMHRVRFEDSNGKLYILGTRYDVTEREALIDQLTRSNEELERFAYIASHDLQAPLRTVSSFTEILNEEYGEVLDETAKKYMAIVIKSANHMKNLVNDLLAYSRLGENAEKSELVDVDEILTYVESNLEEMITITGAQLIRGELPKFEGNPVRFSRVLTNLVGNALKYQSDGNQPVVHITADDLDDVWLFCVKDNGIGMEQEYREQIFLPFKRLHGQSKYVGTGLGLAICRRIVESMGGLIWVESEVDKGSRFSFTIPK